MRIDISVAVVAAAATADLSKYTFHQEANDIGYDAVSAGWNVHNNSTFSLMPPCHVRYNPSNRPSQHELFFSLPE